MKILFELLYIDSVDSLSVNQYAFCLILNYNMQHPEDSLSVLCKSSIIDGIKEKLSDAKVHYIGFDEGTIYDQKIQRVQRRALTSIFKQYDVCISPFANYSQLGQRFCVYHIGIIHDLLREKLIAEKSTLFQRILRRIVCIKRFLLFSKIVTISHSVRKDIKRYTGVNAIVMYNTFGHLTNETKKPSTIDETTPYILDVNSFFKHKNPEILIKAFNEIKNDFPILKLYFKGKDCGHLYIIETLINKLNIKDRVIVDTEDRTSEEMTWLYRHASVFVTPSKMEGFGYTPVEAIVSKTPVISSNIETLHEVLGNNAIFFDPNSPQELAQELREILYNPPSEEELELRSSSIKEKYSVEQHISTLYNLIHKIDNQK